MNWVPFSERMPANGLRITGRNRNDIKDYLAEVFREALSKEEPRT